jgi:hypothetical protein
MIQIYLLIHESITALYRAVQLLVTGSAASGTAGNTANCPRSTTVASHQTLMYRNDSVSLTAGAVSCPTKEADCFDNVSDRTFSLCPVLPLCLERKGIYRKANSALDPACGINVWPQFSAQRHEGAAHPQYCPVTV